MTTIIVIGLWLAVIAFLCYINSQSSKQSRYLDKQFKDANERSKQELASEREWREQMGKLE